MIVIHGLDGSPCRKFSYLAYAGLSLPSGIHQSSRYLHGGYGRPIGFFYKLFENLESLYRGQLKSFAPNVLSSLESITFDFEELHTLASPLFSK